MSKQDIIRMAREAGFEADENDVWITDGYWLKELERFAILVAIQERKRPAMKGCAGITIWGGDATVTKIFTEEEMKYAVDTRALINYSVQQCLDELAAHDTKEQS